jgi:hypothetical protein
LYNKHYYNNLKHVENLTKQTTIRTSKIELLKYNYEEYVDQTILKKYEKINNLFNKILK